MTAFGTVAVYDPAGDARRRLEQVLERCSQGDRLADTILFQEPAPTPTMAVAIDPCSDPSPHHAAHANGSFAVLDGVVFDVGNGAGELLERYVREGDEFFSQVNAAAALLLWDAPRRRLRIYRDHNGIVPSFFARDGDALLWSTVARPLLRYKASADINPGALDFFLAAGFVPSPWSFSAAIEKVPAAHLLHVSPGTAPALRRYWQPVFQRDDADAPADGEERLAALFDQALRRQSAAAERVVVMLSSGVDSKLMLARLAELHRNVEAYTFRYTDYDGIFNEAAAAKRFAKAKGIDHSEIPVSPRDIADGLDDILRWHAEPIAFSINASHLGPLLQRKPSAIFNGNGADSWDISDWDRMVIRHRLLLRFAGQPLARLARRVGDLSGPRILDLACEVCRRYADPFDLLGSAAATGLPWKFALVCPDGNRRALYADRKFMAAQCRARRHLLSVPADESGPRSPEDRLLFIHQQYKRADAMLYPKDSVYRAYGLTVRYPYLDRDFVAAMNDLPPRVRCKETIRRLAARYIPAGAARSPKIAQTIPLGHWFRGPLESFLRDSLGEARVRNSGLFDHRTVARLVDDHVAGRRDHMWKLWALITVLAWQSLARRGDW